MYRTESFTNPAPFLAVRFSWPLLIGAAIFAFLIQNPNLLHDSDTYWHLKVGEWILVNGAIPRMDYFSHTMKGAPWHPHEWLGELLFAVAYAKAGWPAVVICASAAFATALAMLSRYLLRFLEPIYMLGAIALAYSLLAPHLLARPHVLMMPLLVLWAIGLMDAHDEDRAPSLSLLPAMTVWANVHGSFVFGLLLAAAFSVGAIVPARGRRWEVATRWTIFLAASTGAALITPFGPTGLMYAFTVNDMSFALSVINEWQSPNFQKLQPLELCLFVVAAAVLTRGLRLSWLRIALLLGLLHLALKHLRHADLLALLAPLILARPIGEQWLSASVKNSEISAIDTWFRRLVPPASAVGVGVMALLLAVASWTAVRSDSLRPPAKFAPQSALNALQASGMSGRGLNSYEFGGYLIFSGIPTFIDGRADLFGDSFLRTYVSSLNLNGEGGGLTELIKQHDIQWTLLRPGFPAIEFLDQLPGWRRLYSDPNAVVHIRTSQLMGPAVHEGSRALRGGGRNSAQVDGHT
jgi:hypothetical protein